jgi:CheY-like chemotaxis protein
MSTDEPHVPDAALHAPLPPTSEDTPAGSVVLAVDHRRDPRDALVAALRAGGHRVLAAGDASSALDLVARDRPDAALVHHALLDGAATLVRQLRGLAPGLPVIVHGLRATDAAQRGVLTRLAVGVSAADGDDPARLCELAACTVGALRSLHGLRDEHELRGLMIRQLCHTLRAPLEVIQGYTDLLRETPVGAEARAVVEGLARRNRTARPPAARRARHAAA